MVPKFNHLAIFGMSWFAEFNSQTDWHNCSVQLDLDEKQHTVIAAYTADSFFGIDLFIAD